jgi:hypothetical protein
MSEYNMLNLVNKPENRVQRFKLLEKFGTLSRLQMRLI